MALLSREELRKIAELSALNLTDAELSKLLPDIQNVLNYSSELSAIGLREEQPPSRTVNVFRADIVNASTESKSLLEQAPEKQDTFFVVPKIID